jgi:heptosyltransferase-3
MKEPTDDVLDLVREQHSQAVRRSLRALIIQPGAIGDCILTLPLAHFLREALDLGAVDILGHTEYLSAFPGSTCVDAVRSMDAMDLHRLFAEPSRFDEDLADHDPLIVAFSEYTWIVTFLGEPGSPFEKNLIYVTHCSHSAEVVSLRLKPPAGLQGHLAEFYIRQFMDESPVPLRGPDPLSGTALIRPTQADVARGAQILEAGGVDPSGPLVVMHPGSGGKAKCWHVDNFLAVAKEIDAQDTQVVFLLGPAEQERLDRTTKAHLRRRGRVLTDLGLDEVMAVLTRASAFVGNDSGISHLAGALGTRTVVVFGPTDPEAYRPVGPKVAIIQDASSAFAQQPNVETQRAVLTHLGR